MGHVADWVLSLHGGLALLVVFALPALEASAFVGVVVPGETGVLLGGVLANQHRIALWTALLAAVLGAVVGDSVGYEVGRRYGDRLLHRLPGRLVKDEHVDRARQLVRRVGGRAVFVGRFTVALRVLVPGLAGMSRIHYPRFLAWNAAGGITWACGFVLLGFAVGSGYSRVEHNASLAGLVLLGLILAAGAGLWWRRRRAGGPRPGPGSDAAVRDGSPR